MSLQNKLKRLTDDFHNAAAASFSLYFIRWPVGSCRQVDGPPGLRGGPGISTLMNSKLGIFYIQSEDPSVAYGDHLGRLVDRGGKCLELLPEHVHQRIWGRMATQPPSYDAFGWFAALVELAIHGIDGLSAVPHFWDGITSERPSDYEHFREIVAEQEKTGKIRDWYVKIDDLASACCDAADVLLDWALVQPDIDSGSDAGKVDKPNRKMIAGGIKPPVESPADPEPDLTKPDVPDSLRKLQDETPALDIKSADWIAVKAKNKKELGLASETLSKYRSPKNGGDVLNDYFGRDKQWRRWRRAKAAGPNSTVYYYRPDVEKYHPNRG